MEEYFTLHRLRNRFSHTFVSAVRNPNLLPEIGNAWTWEWGAGGSLGVLCKTDLSEYFRLLPFKANPDSFLEKSLSNSAH